MENLNLKPVIRFPEFTENWKETKFKNHFEFKNTNSLSRDKLNYESGTVKNIHYGDIHTKFNTHFDIEKEELPFINEDVDISRIDEENYVLKGDLVMADASEDYADIGKTIEITKTNNEKILAGLHTFLARKTDETLASGFFGHLLTNYNVRLKLMRIAQGTKVLGLSKGRVEQISLAIPKPGEQEKISNSLTSVDNRITLLKEKKDILLDFKKGIMQKIFRQEIRFKDDNGNDFPDWEEKKLGKVFDYKNGGTYENDVVIDGKYFLVTLNSIDITGTLKKEHKTVNFNDNSLKKNDLIMVLSDVAKGFFLGLTAIVPEDNKYVLNQRMGGLSIKTDDNIIFINKFINYNQHYFKLHGQGAAQKNLSKGDITKFDILLPKKEEQNKIAKYLTALDDKIGALQQKIDTSVSFKKGLLQKMFV